MHSKFMYLLSEISLKPSRTAVASCLFHDPLVNLSIFREWRFGMPELGGPGGHCPPPPLRPRLLADQLTLFQPGRQFLPNLYYWHPQIFRPSDFPVSDVRVGGGDSIFADKNKLTPSPQNYKIIISNIIN